MSQFTIANFEVIELTCIVRCCTSLLRLFVVTFLVLVVSSDVLKVADLVMGISILRNLNFSLLVT